MALLLFDGFGATTGSTTVSHFLNKWDDIANGVNYQPAVGGERFLGGSHFTFIFTTPLYKSFPGYRNHLWIGMAIQIAASGHSPLVFALYDNNTIQCSIIVGPSRELDLYRGDATTGTNQFLVSSSNNVIAAGGSGIWDFIDFELKLHTSTGSISMWKNDVLIFTSSANLNTCLSGVPAANKLRMGDVIGRNQQWNFTDIHVVDDQPGIGPTSRIGDSRVVTLWPRATGSLNGWVTATSGSIHTVVKNRPPDEDTSFASASISGSQQRFVFDAMPTSATGSIIAMNHGYRVRKDDALTRQVSGSVVVGGVELTGSVQNIGASYLSYIDTYDKDSTGAPLTIAQINAIEAGINLIT